jgi:UDP-N-acetyl-D-glucosamine dehydrogenase
MLIQTVTARHSRHDSCTAQPPPEFAFDLAVVGLGYVGLPTSLAFEAAGGTVLGIDASHARLDAINARKVDLLDSDRQRLAHALDGERFTITSDVARLGEAKCVLVCVPTPVDEYLVPDLTMLDAACETVAAHARAGQVLILTSTTYVGCTRDLLNARLQARGLVPGQNISLAFSPERIDPGNSRASADVPRVLGGMTTSCAARAESLLSRVGRVHTVSSPEAAELTKLLENTFRAVNIAMINEFAEISNGLDLDVMEVIDAASTKPYGFMRFTPGPGVGGHCIPCDPHYLLWQLNRQQIDAPVISQSMQAIALRPRRVIQRISETLSVMGMVVPNARILVLGVAYKPDVEDMRESPAIEIIQRLLALGATVGYHDPMVDSVRLPDGRIMTSTPDPAFAEYDLVLAHTMHSQIDTDALATAPLILDATYRLALGERVVRL